MHQIRNASLLVVRKKNVMGKKEECIRLVRKKYNRLARRNAVHQTKKIKWLNGGRKKECIDIGENLRHRGKRNAYNLKEIFHQLKKECMKKKASKMEQIALDWKEGVTGVREEPQL